MKLKRTRLLQLSLLLSLLSSLLLSPRMLISQASTIPNLTTDTSPLGTDWMIVHKVGETRSKKQSRDQVCRIASSTTLPATCTVGDRYWDIDADTDGSLFVCRATNVWKEVDDDGGAGGGGAPTDSQYLVLSADTTLTNERIYTTGVGLSGVDSGAGAAYTIGFWRGDTLASNPTYSSEDVVFTTDGTGGGLLFEGSTADATEGILVWDPSSTDKTITLPNITGTVITTGDIGTVTGTMIASSTIPDGDLTSNYSGVGACTGTDKVSTLNDNAAPTCTADDDTPDSDSEVPNAITLSGGTIAANTLTGAIKTSGLLDEGGQASVGASPHYLGIADGSVASPTTDPQPSFVVQRTDSGSTSSIPFQFTYTKTDGTGFHYPLHVFVRNKSNKVSDIVAVSGSVYAEPTPLVTNLAATPSGSGGTLATATYSYYATAIVGGTEIVAGEHVDAAVTGPTGSVALTWTAVASATAYRVYRYVPAAPATAPVYFETASTSLTDTGAAGTSATGPSQTLWGGWWRVEKSATADSGRLAGGETDIINNSGRDPGPRPDRVGSTIGHQYVSAGNADNSIGIHLTGESDSQFHTGVLFDSFSFDQVGIDFSLSDATKPAILLANNQPIQAMAGTVPVNLMLLNSSLYLELLRPLATEVAGLTLANGANNDLPIGVALEHISIGGPTAAFSVTGIASGVKGRKIVLYNMTSQAMTIANESASSTAANRIITKTGADLVLPARPSLVRLFYNTGQSRWVVETEDLVTSGGGGSSNSFETINTPAGTDPVADSATDTLNVTCSSGLTCTGTSGTDTLDISLSDPLNVMDLVDEFIGDSTETGEVGILGWSYGATSNALVSGVTKHPGIFQISTNTSNGNIARLHLGGASTSIMMIPAEVVSLEFLVRFSSTSSAKLKCGMGQDLNSTTYGTDGIWLGYDFQAGTSPANWRFATRASSSETNTASGTAAAANTWVYFKLIRTSGGDWEGYFNNNIIGTHTTNIPTVGMNIGCTIETREAVAKSIDVDYFRLKGVELGTRWE